MRYNLIVNEGLLPPIPYPHKIATSKLWCKTQPPNRTFFWKFHSHQQRRAVKYNIQFDLGETQRRL
jgi:hypothetical protein